MRAERNFELNRPSVHQFRKKSPSAVMAITRQAQSDFKNMRRRLAKKMKSDGDGATEGENSKSQCGDRARHRKTNGVGVQYHCGGALQKNVGGVTGDVVQRVAALRATLEEILMEF